MVLRKNWAVLLALMSKEEGGRQSIMVFLNVLNYWQYPDGYLESQAAKEKEAVGEAEEIKNEDSAPKTKGRKRKAKGTGFFFNQMFRG